MYTLLVPGWTPFCLQNCLNSSWHRFNKVLKPFLKDFGPFDMIASRSCSRFVGCISMMRIRAVKLAEKLNSIFFTKILSKSELYSNLKGINSVREKKSIWLLSWGDKRAHRAKYTKCMFLQSRAVQYEQNFISLYFLADLLYISRYFVFVFNK